MHDISTFKSHSLDDIESWKMQRKKVDSSLPTNERTTGAGEDVNEPSELATLSIFAYSCTFFERRRYSSHRTANATGRQRYALISVAAGSAAPVDALVSRFLIGSVTALILQVKQLGRPSPPTFPGRPCEVSGDTFEVTNSHVKDCRVLYSDPDLIFNLGVVEPNLS